MNFHITESDEEFDREKATAPEPVDIKSPKTKPQFVSKPFDFKSTLEMKKEEPPAVEEKIPKQTPNSIPSMNSSVP